MALVTNVYELNAFKEAYIIVNEVWDATETMPKHELYGGSGSQLRRCASSICANLAEGFGKSQSRLELRRFVRIALGSAHETDFWLKLLADRRYMEPEKATDLRERCKNVCRMLKGFEKSIAVASPRTPQITNH